MQPLGDSLERRLIDRFGPGARRWLAGLPELAAGLAERWGVQLDADAPPVGGQTSVVLFGWRSGGRDGTVTGGGDGPGSGGAGDDEQAVVLKLAYEPALARDEAHALSAWAAGSVVPPPVPLVHAHDLATGALLLEAIKPGRALNLTTAPPSQAAVGRLLRALGAPLPSAERPRRDVPLTVGAASPPPGLPSLRERVDFCFELWLARRAANPVARATVPDGALERGHELARELADDRAAPSALVHGDLHPGNVLGGGPGRGLVAIDPRACVGDPGFDAVDLTLWGVETIDAADARVAAVALHTGGDAERLQAWCAALAAMSAASLASRPRPGTTRRIETLLAIAA